MTVTLIYKCRLCGGWERRDGFEFPLDIMGYQRYAAIHQCSEKMTGVADFAGIEMVEEEETGC
jgi:hypothetical protein